MYLIINLYRAVQLNAFQICQLGGYRFNMAMPLFVIINIRANYWLTYGVRRWVLIVGILDSYIEVSSTKLFLAAVFSR
jgi:hypothetical protein